MNGRVVIKGAKAIADAIGEYRGDISRLVEKEGLPAWRSDGRGPWKAIPQDLHEWAKKQRDKYLSISISC